MLKFIICLHEQPWVSNCGTSFLPLGYTFWCSVNTPELLVVALHQALLISSGFAFHHSFITSYLSFFLENNVYFTLADPAMPIGPTCVATGYPLY
jgi:hypothetical protein